MSQHANDCEERLDELLDDDDDDDEDDELLDEFTAGFSDEELDAPPPPPPPPWKQLPLIICVHMSIEAGLVRRDGTALTY